MREDYFEIDRVIEELAKSYAAPCATSWFKVSNIRKPSQEEYRNKVVDFIRQFEQTLAILYPNNNQSEEFKEYVRSGLRGTIHGINNGNNKEVERRFRYYTEYN
jgi:hypothetical protein